MVVMHYYIVDHFHLYNLDPSNPCVTCSGALSEPTFHGQSVKFGYSAIPVFTKELHSVILVLIPQHRSTAASAFPAPEGSTSHCVRMGQGRVVCKRSESLSLVPPDHGTALPVRW